MRCYPLFLAPFLLLAGCSQQSRTTAPNSSQKAGFKKALPPDDLGRPVKLDKVPQRIVTIGPGATEIVFALGAGNRLVGRDSGSDYPPQVSKIPVIGNFTGPFFEKTLAVRPDFIIVQGETWDKGRIELWQKKCHAPVVALTAKSIREVTQGIVKIGAWLDVPQVANELAKKISFFPPPIKGHPTAFFEIQRSPLYTAGRGTLIDDVMSKAGLKNVAEIEGYKQYSIEKLVAQQPRFYIVTIAKANIVPDKTKILNDLRRRPGFRDLECLRAGRLIIVPADSALRPGPRLPEGIGALYENAISNP